MPPRTLRPPLTLDRWIRRIVVGAIVVGAAALAAVSWGPSGVGWADLFSPLLAEHGLGRTILFSVRLPRVAAAGVLGAALAVAGVAFQAMLRNPLADPYVLGVSGGASLGAVLALVAGLGGGAYAGLAIPAAGFVGALVALAAIERVATVGGRLTVYTLLLTGAVFNAFSAALVFFLQSVASLEELRAMLFLLMGRVPSLPLATIVGLGAATLVVTVRLMALARAYNALALGEETAAQLGVDVERLRRTTFVWGSLLTALAVSFAGLVGFVGLVVPHALRRLFGPDHRLLLPLSALTGATFLVVADLVARTLLAPNELPVGVVTALVGGPAFLVILRRRGARHE